MATHAILYIYTSKWLSAPTKKTIQQTEYWNDRNAKEKSKKYQKTTALTVKKKRNSNCSQLVNAEHKPYR